MVNSSFVFVVGTFCNHYFLRMLAMISGGHYDSAYDVGRFQLLFLDKNLLSILMLQNLT